ncbi:VanZ family protein [Ruminococcus sp.]|uniref:VanZ family protein n=1 Tax=Ruminococcus sp. TaxID=41978 RepID=UPI0025D2E024|nr:VanZ family protein [Ruminococcus sp.]MBR1431530.1 VanZ family protein [Ruminococcus sp.]
MKRALQFISLIPIVILLLYIFAFSAEDAEESTSTSKKVVVVVAEIIVEDFDKLPETKAKSIIESMTSYIRKLAHFTEFALLGLFIALHILTLTRIYPQISISKLLPFSWGSGTIAAVSDEFHQIFVPGRSCSLIDMTIDSMGVLSGTLIVLLVIAIIYKKSDRR